MAVGAIFLIPFIAIFFVISLISPEKGLSSSEFNERKHKIGCCWKTGRFCNIAHVNIRRIPSLLTNLLLDLVYGLADPRVRYGKG